MKFGQFMSYYKRKNFIKKFYRNCGLYADLYRIFFTEDSLKIKLFDKKNSFVILHKLAKFHYKTVFTSQVIQ